MSSKGGWRPAAPLTLCRLPHSGRGFVAASHIPPGSLIVSIPMSLLITRNRAFRQTSVRVVDFAPSVCMTETVHSFMGERVLSQPLAKLVTLVDAWRNDLTRSKAAAVLGNSVANMPSNIRTHDLLATFLIRCKSEGEGMDSYRPYVESLPESYSVPFFCSEREAASLPRYQSKYISLCKIGSYSTFWIVRQYLGI